MIMEVEFIHLIDKSCKIPRESDRWWKEDTYGVNDKINAKFTKYEEPFDDDLP